MIPALREGILLYIRAHTEVTESGNDLSEKVLRLRGEPPIGQRRWSDERAHTSFRRLHQDMHAHG